MKDVELEKKAVESYAKRLKDSSYYETGEEGAYICGYIASAKEMQEEAQKEIIEIEKVSDERWEENKQFAKRICELQSDLVKAKSQIEKNDMLREL